MATSGNTSSSGYQGRYIYFEWWTNSISADNNTRTIGYRFTAKGGSSSIYYHHDNVFQLNGDTVYSGSSSEAVTTNDVMAEGTYTINQNNTNKLRVDMDGGIYSYADNINTAQEWTLDDIPRYATLTSLNVKSKTINSITLSYTTDRNAWLFAKINDGDWLNNGEPFKSNTTSGEFTISYKDRAGTQRLDPNTTYKITVLCRAVSRDSDLDTSKDISVTTYQIAQISNLGNFNHGDNANIVITNPSSSSLSLAMKIGNTQILSKSVNAGTNTINFSDKELDNIYKLYGSSNSLTATFIVTTASKYTNSKTCAITLKRKSKNNKK